MAGAVLMVPPVVEIGDVSVVEKDGLLESSLSLCSLIRFKKQKRKQNLTTALNRKTSLQVQKDLFSDLECFESSLFLFESCLLLPLIHFSERHPCAGQ